MEEEYGKFYCPDVNSSAGRIMLFLPSSQQVLALGLLVGVHCRDHRGFRIILDETHTIDLIALAGLKLVRRTARRAGYFVTDQSSKGWTK
jgi:hypothetical protein